MCQGRISETSCTGPLRELFFSPWITMVLYHTVIQVDVRKLRKLLPCYNCSASARFIDERRSHDHVTMDAHIRVWDVHDLHNSQGIRYTWITTVCTTSHINSDYVHRSLCLIKSSAIFSLFLIHGDRTLLIFTLIEGWISASPTILFKIVHSGPVLFWTTM